MLLLPLEFAACALLQAPTHDVPATIASTSWTVDDGLPQNSVRSIDLDEHGYLWIATFGGLARFDGRRFEVYDVGSRDDLPGNRFAEIAAGPQGDLWAVLIGVGLLHHTDGEFRFIPTPTIPRHIAVGNDGTPWITCEESLGRIERGRWVEVLAEAPSSVHARSNGEVWVVSADRELIVFDAAMSPAPPRAIPGDVDEPILAMTEDASGVMWLACRTGVWRTSGTGDRSLVEVRGAPLGVQAIEPGIGSTLWFDCYRGLYAHDSDSGEFRLIEATPIQSMRADSRGSLWVSEERGVGLRCLRPSPLSSLTSLKSTTTPNTWSISSDGSGRVIVVEDRGVHELHGEGSTFHHVQSNTRTALIDRGGDLWVGHGGGLLRIRGEEREEVMEHLSEAHAVRALAEFSDGSLWIGSNLGLLRWSQGRLERILPSEVRGVRSLLEDPSNGVVWIGTSDGLARLEGGELTWIRKADGLSPGRIRALHLDERGVLWAGSYGGGLSRIEGDAVTRYTRLTGLPDDFITSILEDDRGRFWIHSNKGPFVVRREALDRVAAGDVDRVGCALFTRHEGAREANGGGQPSSWLAPDGRMWFPTVDGVTIANPAALSVEERPPNLRIESLELDDDRHLRVRFAALGFSAPQRTRVQYRLVGQDDAWRDWVGSAPVEYSYLPPGDYTLMLRGRNGFGPWSPILAEQVQVVAALHETPAFLVCVALAGGALAFGFAERRVRTARARAERLERLHRERERAEAALSKSQAALSRLSRGLLATQDNERRHVSSELHDDVTQRIAALAINLEVIEARLEVASDRTREQLQSITRAAQNLAGDVQQLSRRLHPAGLLTLGLSEAIRQECDAFSRRSGAKVEILDHVASDELPEDVAVAAFRIFQEGLHNVEKHALATYVVVGQEIEGKEYELTLRDSGRGFDTNSDSDKGLGLITMQERAATIGGRLKIESGPDTGTSLRLLVPLDRNTP